VLFLLDTDIASYIIKGGYGPIEKRLAATAIGDVFISAITRAELMFGLKTLGPRHHLHRDVANFLSTGGQMAWDGAAADVHAALRYQLNKAGTPIGTMDTFIAAHGISLGATLVTNNMRHYRQIRMPIRLANWME
jgi:tRNA(fMet)-specific endonuclease VapC